MSFRAFLDQGSRLDKCNDFLMGQSGRREVLWLLNALNRALS